jgi:hypothetical protein
VPSTADVPGDGLSGLSGLLVLLHGSDAPFRSLQATYRVWREEQRAAEASMSGVQEEKHRGVPIATFGASLRRNRPAETVETFRLWWYKDRVREEFDGGWRDGRRAVRDGERWWSWDRERGVATERDYPDGWRQVGLPLNLSLDPRRCLGSCGLPSRVTGSWPAERR